MQAYTKMRMMVRDRFKVRVRKNLIPRCPGYTRFRFRVWVRVRVRIRVRARTRVRVG